MRLQNLFVALALISCAGANLHAEPSWLHRHWRTIAGDAVIIGALVADGHSTCRGFAHGLVEGNRLARGSHNCGATIGILAGAGVGYVTLNYFSHRLMHDDPNKYWRFAGYWSVPAIVAAGHGGAGWHNYLLEQHRPPPPPPGPTR